MAENKDKFVRLIAKLLELTQENKMEWEVVDKDSGSEPSSTKIIGAIFEAQFNKKNLRIYKREHDNTQENLLLHSMGLDSGIYSSPYTFSITLGFTDESGNMIWKFPKVSGITDLYDAVTFQAADIDDFINEVLSDSDS